MPRSRTPGWKQPAAPLARVRLRFPQADQKVVANFSAGTRAGETLFVAADEHALIHRLAPSGEEWIEVEASDIAELLPVAWPDEEADIEGLAADDGWLWVLGSHARTRPKPEKAPGECIDLDLLADLKDTRSRALIGRIPLVRLDGTCRLASQAGERKAGMLKQGKHGNALYKALKNDPLLGPFTRVPAKEGGVDIEGIAVCGDRVALGMRGPVIATHAVLLELTVRPRPSGRLQLASEPVKRLLALEGLGIRDLKRRGDDLLILAGPTTHLSGPCALYRWPDWANDPPQDAQRVRLHRPERLLELPFGRGVDHPEGLALWPDEDRILVIYDSPDRSRLVGDTVAADLFRLPD